MEEYLNNITVNITGGELSEAEQQVYLNNAFEQFGPNLYQVDFEVDGEYVNVKYHTHEIPFERIRRITGYLVGTMDKWNDAKRAEEHDRVHHEFLDKKFNLT